MLTLEGVHKTKSFHGDNFLHIPREGEAEFIWPLCYSQDTRIIASLGLIAVLARKIEGNGYLAQLEADEEILNVEDNNIAYMLNATRTWLSGRVPRTTYQEIFQTYQRDIQLTYVIGADNYSLSGRYGEIELPIPTIPDIAQAIVEPVPGINDGYFNAPRHLLEIINQYWT